MIISHNYKFIFLKTRKTAGTSIEIALSRFCGDNDIITPITPEDEMIREKLGYRGPQNYFIGFSKYTARDLVRLIIRRKRTGYYNHMTANMVQNRIESKIWNSYFKFCIERNPWDKAISLYFYDTYNSETKISLLKYLIKVDTKKLSNFEIYGKNNGNLAVNRVALYENLEQELERIAEQLHLPNKFELPKAKRKYRKDRRNYREVMGQEERDLVAKICSSEIAMFGYSF